MAPKDDPSLIPQPQPKSNYLLLQPLIILAFIRVFMRLCDQCENEVRGRALQLSHNLRAVDSVRPVNLKFCVDPEYLESAVSLGFIPNDTTYESLEDETP